MQNKALRRHAVPILNSTPGLPLIKRTADLGLMAEWRKGRIDCPAGMPEKQMKARVRWAADRFIEWQYKEDHARFLGKIKVHGPFPHFEAKPPNTQHGDNGASRKVARNVQGDLQGEEKVDYVIEALFEAPEYVTELPTDLAVDLFKKRGDIRPMREREWRTAKW